MEGNSDDMKSSAINSRRRKYIDFAIKYKHKIPSLIPVFPVHLQDLMKFTLYLASDEGNVKGGWSSCQNYVTEILTLGKLRGWTDPREGTRNTFLWNRFRTNFRTQIQKVQKAPTKLRLSPAHLQSIVLALDTDDFTGLKWATAFVTLWHSNARVGHCAAKSKKFPKHVWKWEDLVFTPSMEQATAVVVHFRSSKTRAATEIRPFWTALGRVNIQPGQPNTCPVSLLKAWFQRAYTGNPTDPLFGADSDPSTPILRGAFTKKLRECLTAGAKFLAPPHNVPTPESYSGVSFRKGSLSAMSGCVDFNRLRERADHKCPESTAHYVVDSVQTRAQSSADVHARFGQATHENTQTSATENPQSPSQEAKAAEDTATTHTQEGTSEEE